MAERRIVVEELTKTNDSVLKLCNYAEFSRTQFYYSKSVRLVKSVGRPCPGHTVNRDGKKIYDEVILNYLKEYRQDIHFVNSVGSRQLTNYLSSEKHIFINHKKIYRMCKENNLLLFRSKEIREKIKKTRCEFVDITAPNQLWQFDLKHIYIHGEQRWCYLLAFIDVFNKKAVGYYIGKTVKATELIFTLNEALKKEGITHEHNLKIRSDNGPQMSSNKFHFYLKKLEQKLKHEFIPPRTPNRNAYIESFFSIVEKTIIEVRYFKTFGDVYEAIVKFIEFYNNRRLHGSIGNISPKTFIEKFKNGEIKNFKISA